MPPPRKARRPSKTDAAPPDFDRELRGLQLFLRQTREFRLALALYSDVRDRDEMIARLGMDLAVDAIQVLTVNLTESSQSRTLSGRIEAALKAKADPAQRQVVMVVNLDAAVEHLPELSNTVSEGTEFFATANLHRELFPRLCPAPLVIWLTESMERAFAAQAPDLWHWRSHVFDLRTPRRFTFPPAEADSTTELSATDLLHAETRLLRLEEELAAYRKVGSRPDEMRVLFNMGNARMDLGQPRLARYDYEAVLRIAQEVGSEEWHLLAEGGIANASAAIGDFAMAEPLFRRVLEARERMLGAEHPSTLISLNNFAALLKVKGDLAGAEPLYRRTLEACERTLGAEHPSTLITLNNLATLLSDQGDLVRAEPLHRRALEARERTLGVEHPDTLSSLNNFASLLKDKGDLAGAEPLYRRALEVLERKWGEEHPNSLTSLNNLGALHEARGDWVAAEGLYRRAVAGARKQLLPDHPHREVYERNWARVLAKLGRTEEG